MFEKILIANRGEIACRVIRTAQKMGIATVAVHSDADSKAMHVMMADEAVRIGPAASSESYLSIDNVIKAAIETSADAVHPGYGFLSEASAFARALVERNITFIGPPPAAIDAMGDKLASKRIARDSGVNTIPGYMGIVADAGEAVSIARDIGYPVMIKASAGGGGKGMRIAHDASEVEEGFRSSQNEAASAFGDDRILIEKFITSPRHIEIQILADTHGNCIHLNERECSIQRRNQKVIEEAPSPFIDDETRRAMGMQASALALAVDYHSAGTVEFIVDSSRNFYFLEMNTRLQVEHPVTELTTGTDLVEEMIRIAHGEPLRLKQDDVAPKGWAMESRIYAEDPERGFLPSTGRLVRYRPPANQAGSGFIIRNDTGVCEGGEISVYYDPMIAKLCSWGPDRSTAIDVMRSALDQFVIEGIASNISFLSAVMDHEKFVSGNITTAFIDEEYAGGFHGLDPDPQTTASLVAVAAVMHCREMHRNARISGRMKPPESLPGQSLVAIAANDSFSIGISGDEASQVDIDGHGTRTVDLDWLPGKQLARALVNSQEMYLKVRPITGGYLFIYRGSEAEIRIYGPRQAELYAHMPVKTPPDMSARLLCPMPGLLVSIAVNQGDEVVPGQPLCVVEAMKMENVLKAERKARIAKILVKPGDTMAVDDTIMEFE